jgi:hypothetical protein
MIYYLLVSFIIIICLILLIGLIAFLNKNYTNPFLFLLMNEKNKMKFVDNEVNEIQNVKIKILLILKTIITLIIVVFFLINFRKLSFDLRYLIIIILFLIRYGVDYFISKILIGSRK